MATNNRYFDPNHDVLLTVTKWFFALRKPEHHHQQTEGFYPGLGAVKLVMEIATAWFDLAWPEVPVEKHNGMVYRMPMAAAADDVKSPVPLPLPGTSLLLFKLPS